MKIRSASCLFAIQRRFAFENDGDDDSNPFIIRFNAVCLTILRADRRTRPQHLPANDLRFRWLGQ